MKKALSILMSFVILLTVTSGLKLTANAKEISGSCGDGVTYNLNTSNGVLTISGKGAIYNYYFVDFGYPYTLMHNVSTSDTTPWFSLRNVKT